ncbi:unnamed protein product, partial [marine sediment metagenome]
EPEGTIDQAHVGRYVECYLPGWEASVRIPDGWQIFSIGIEKGGLREAVEVSWDKKQFNEDPVPVEIVDRCINHLTHWTKTLEPEDVNPLTNYGTRVHVSKGTAEAALQGLRDIKEGKI